MNILTISLDKLGKASIEKINDFKDDLPSIYKLLDCNYFEPVAAQHARWTLGISNVVLLVDEEGAIKPSPVVNLPATILYMNSKTYPIFGNAIVCKIKPSEGELDGLTEDEMNKIIEYIKNKMP